MPIRQNGVLYSETFGTGPDVVMVHGWGMHSGVWRVFAHRLADCFRITLIDLPGHGRSGMIADFSLEGAGKALLEIAPERAHWLGWSLGATISLQVAGHSPERLASLAMMAGNARFSQCDGWPCAMDLPLLSGFAADLRADYHHTLMQFLGLQTMGLEHARAVLRDLKAHVTECEEPDEAALQAGLDILCTGDLRDLLPELRMPLLLLLGSRDRMVKPAVGQAMQALSCGAELQIIEGAAHTPFLSHADECLTLLTDFWQRHND